MCVRFLRSVFDLEQIIGVFNRLNSVTKADLKCLKINTEDGAGLFLNYITQTSRSVTLWLKLKTGIRYCCERIDTLYNVPAAQTFGAGSVPAMRLRPPTSSRALPAVWLPVWGGRWDRRPGLYTWNASCPVEAPPLFCVFEKLCTDPQVKWKGPWYSTERSWETEHTNLLRLQSLQRYLICCCP